MHGATGTASANDRSARSAVVQRRPPGTAGAGNDEQLPVYADGYAIHTYKKRGDTYVHRHKFVSTDLDERYGDPIVEYEPSEIPAELISDEFEDAGTAKVSYPDRQIVGTAAEHAVAETRIHRARLERAADTHTHLVGEIPIYHYESANDAQYKQARKVPINVGWENATSAAQVKEFTEEECNWSQYSWLPTTSGYINGDGTIRSTDADVQDRIQFTEQWHVRLYDIDHSSYTVIGQIHRNPLNHNHGIKIDDWNFTDAKEELVEDWTDHSSRYSIQLTLDNGSAWDSHDGQIGLLKE